MSLNQKPIAILTSYWMDFFSRVTPTWIPSSWIPPNNEVLLIQALKALNIQAELVVWNHPNIDWTKYQACVIRSTWDYHESKKNTAAFLSMVRKIDKMGSVILNPCSTIEWNINKNYLKHLSREGVPVVETIWLEKKNLASFEKQLLQKGWQDCVIKPVISASGMHTKKFNVKDSAKIAKELDSLDVDEWMVQPFMEEIVQEGEISFIFIQNKFSHCVLKKPAFGHFLVQGGTARKFEPTPDFIAQAEKILTLANQKTLYARVDVIRKENQLVLMELELVEPNLYLHFDDKAAGRLASAISSVFQ